MPGTENAEYSFMFPGFDKLLHLSIFAFLGICFSAAYPKIKFLYYIYIMLIYAIVTELLQDLMGLGRSAETLDLVADVVGVVIGHYIYKVLCTKFFNN